MFIGIRIAFLYLLMEGHYKLLQLFGFLCWFGFFSCQSFFLQAIENFCLFKWNYSILNNTRFISLSMKNTIFHFQTIYHLSEDILMSLGNITSGRPSLLSKQRVCMFILRNNCNESKDSSVVAQSSSKNLRIFGANLFRTLSKDSNCYWSLRCFKSATIDINFIWSICGFILPQLDLQLKISHPLKYLKTKMQ